MYNLVSAFGILVLLFGCYLCSAHRRAIRWRAVIWGIALQVGFALLILKTTPGRWFFSYINDLVLELLAYQRVGAEFVFGVLAIPLPNPGSVGFIFAFQVVPTIIFFSSLMAILYHCQVIQHAVSGFSRVMKGCLGTSGAETFAVSANVFLGYIESPLLIRPYLKGMTRSELVMVMTAGMATVAGGVMVAFVGMLKDSFPDIAGHLLAASVMSVPAAVAIAKLLVPETEQPATMGHVKSNYRSEYQNVIDAAASGATGAVTMVLNIMAVLIAFMAILALANGLVGWAFGWLGLEGITVQSLFGYVFAPIAWLIGVPFRDGLFVGELIAEKTIINEFVAFVDLGEFLKANPDVLAPRTVTIATYALCGFANFLSLGAMLGGLIALVPERKKDIAKNGFISLVGGALASLLTAAIAGMLIG